MVGLMGERMHGTPGLHKVMLTTHQQPRERHGLSATEPVTKCHMFFCILTVFTIPGCFWGKLSSFTIPLMLDIEVVLFLYQNKMVMVH